VTDETLTLDVTGAGPLATSAEMTVLSGSPEDTNSINRPRNVVPVATTLRHVKPHLALTVPANGIVVLKLRPKS
ncbi:MAG TPA: hypothetical protein VF988_09320, partial [Verrucomicrobiae bacterium]